MEVNLRERDAVRRLARTAALPFDTTDGEGVHPARARSRAASPRSTSPALSRSAASSPASSARSRPSCRTSSASTIASLGADAGAAVELGRERALDAAPARLGQRGVGDHRRPERARSRRASRRPGSGPRSRARRPRRSAAASARRSALGGLDILVRAHPAPERGAPAQASSRRSTRATYVRLDARGADRGDRLAATRSSARPPRSAA